jgi:hypothetical protein
VRRQMLDIVLIDLLQAPYDFMILLRGLCAKIADMSRIGAYPRFVSFDFSLDLKRPSNHAKDDGQRGNQMTHTDAFVDMPAKIIFFAHSSLPQIRAKKKPRKRGTGYLSEYRE